MHLYGSADGKKDTTIYVPAGFKSHKNIGGTSGAVAFFYEKLGNLRNVTLVVRHVANFQLGPEEGGRHAIGQTGGLDQGHPQGPTYRHAHLELFKGNWLGKPGGAPSASTRSKHWITFSSAFCK